MNTTKKPKKVLVIDDDEGILEAVRAVLDYEGYQVITNSTGRNFIDKLKSDPPNIILLDLLISGKDGRTVAQEIKQDAVFQKIPIVMLSAHPTANEAAIASGVDDFLPKPFDINDLVATIEKHTNPPK